MGSSFWFMAYLYPGGGEANNVRFLLCMTPFVFAIYWFYIKSPSNGESILESNTSPKITKKYKLPYTLLVGNCENCKKLIIIKKKETNENDNDKDFGSFKEHNKAKNTDDENVDDMKNDENDNDENVDACKTEIVDPINDPENAKIVKLF